MRQTIQKNIYIYLDDLGVVQNAGSRESREHFSEEKMKKKKWTNVNHHLRHHLHKSHNLTCGLNIFPLRTSSTSTDLEIWLFVEAHQHLCSLIAKKLKTHSNCKVICGAERGSKEDGHQMLPVNCPVKSAHWVSCKMSITVCYLNPRAQINLIIIWLASINFLQLTCSTVSTEEVTRQKMRLTCQTSWNQMFFFHYTTRTIETRLEKIN